MEDAWRAKCSSTWTPPPSAPPLSSSPAPPQPQPQPSPSSSANQMEKNPRQVFHPIFMQGTTLRNPPVAQEPLVFRTLNLDFAKSANTDLGNSFMALLSANPHHFPNEFSQLAKLHAHNGGVIVGNASPGAQVTGVSSLSQNIPSASVWTAKNLLGESRPSLMSNSTKTPALCSSLQVAVSHCHASASSKPVLGQTFEVNTARNPSISCSLPCNYRADNTSQNNLLNIHSAQGMPTEGNSTVSGYESGHPRSRPRVICVNTVGELFLSELGLLGVICFCHGLRMSVGKFCEHSGSSANPGEAVRLENGMTVARWRNLCFGKNAPDDCKGWDWSDGPSTKSSFIEPGSSSLPSQPQNHGTADSVRTVVGLGKSGDHRNKILCSKPPYPGLHQTANKNPTNNVSDHMYQWNRLEGERSTIPSKSHMTALAKDHTVLGTNRRPDYLNPGASRLTLNSGEQNAWSHLVTARDNCKEKVGTSSLLYPHSDAKSLSCEFNINRNNFGSEPLEVSRNGHSSKIDLQLGQPSHVLPPLNSLSASINPLQLGAVCNRQKSQVKFPLTEKTAHPLETKQPMMDLWHTSLQPSISNRGQSQNAVGIRNNSSNSERNELTANETKSSLISLFLSHLNTERSTVVNDSKYPMLDLTSGKCNFSEHASNTNGGKERNKLSDGSDLSNNLGKGKHLINFGNGACDTVKTNYTVHNKEAIATRVLPPVSAGQHICSGSSADNRTLSSHFDQPSINLQKKPNLVNFNQYENILSARDMVHCTSASGSSMNLVSYGASRPGHLNIGSGAPVNLTSTNSRHISEITSAPINTKDTCHAPHGSDDNMKILALRHMVELSKQDWSTATLEVNPRHQRSCYHSGIKLQRNLCNSASAAAEDLCQRTYCDIQQHASDFTVVPPQSCSTCFSGNGAEMLAGKTGTRGQNGYCKCTTLTPKISPCSKEHDIPTCHLCCADDHQCLRLVRMPNYGFEPSDSGSKIFDRKEQHACCCSVLPKQLTGCCFTGNLSSSNYPNKQNVCGKHILKHRSQACLEINTTQDRKGVDLCECTSKHFIMRNDCLTGLWRDVPAKKLEHSDATSVDKPAKVLKTSEGTSIRLPGTADKRFEATQQEFDSVNEHQMSNICSGSSAPAVTEISVEVNKTSYQDTNVEDDNTANDVVADEGSGVEKCGSSDEALDTRGSEEDRAINGKVERDKYGYSLPSQASGDLIDELRLETSSNKKRVKNLGHVRYTDQENIKRKKILTAEIRKVQTNINRPGMSVPKSLYMTNSESPHCLSHLKWEFSSLDKTKAPYKPETMMQRSSVKRKRSFLPPAEPLSQKTKSHHNMLESDKLQIGDNDHSLRTSAISPGEEEQNMHAGEEFAEHESIHLDSEKPPKYMSLSHIAKSSNHEMQIANKKVRPVVCGRSGIISSGGLSGQKKPPKFISLSLILKRSKKCDVKECVVKSKTSSDSRTRKMLPKADDGCCNESSFSELHCENKDAKINDNDHSSVCILGTSNGCSSRSDDDTDEFSKIENEKDGRDNKDEQTVLHHDPKGSTRPRCREVRKCSLSKLIEEDKHATMHSYAANPGASYSSIMIGTGDQPAEFPSTTTDVGLGEKTLDNKGHADEPIQINIIRSGKVQDCQPSLINSDVFCCVCGSSNKEEFNCILECNRCSIKVHQACYGVSKAPRGHWFCRPCKSNSLNTVCVLCGYGGGAMTKAVKSQNIVKSLLKTWNFGSFMKSVYSSETVKVKSVEQCFVIEASKCDHSGSVTAVRSACCKAFSETATSLISTKQASDSMPKGLQPYNSITAGVLDPSVTQWVHMVCGLWTPGTRCPNVDTMNAFDVSGASAARKSTVCSMCNRSGGCCIQCRVLKCNVYFHPWCAHQKGLLQSEIEGDDNENVGFYGKCMLHADRVGILVDSNIVGTEVERPKENRSCARTEGFKGRKSEEVFKFNHRRPKHDNGGCVVSQEQINAWLHIQKSCTRAVVKPPSSDIEHDFRKEYFRYKQLRAWKHLVVYKSGIHALGLYTSQLIARGAMVVEYVGEIVGLRVADKREIEYQSGRRLQYKSACYFFRIDKEHIIDATRKGGIARFVNHSCQPNCVAKVISIRNEKKVVFFAERDINPGEEITYDYHFNSEDEGQKIPCYCNSNNCRRFLN